jgi:hypothetical protein
VVSLGFFKNSSLKGQKGGIYTKGPCMFIGDKMFDVVPYGIVR